MNKKSQKIKKCAEQIRECAEAWDQKCCLIGNITAGEIIEVMSLIVDLENENKDLKCWRAISKADYDRLGKALEPVRKKRQTGEPATSDGEAVEEVVNRYMQLEAENQRLRKELAKKDGSKEKEQEIADQRMANRTEELKAEIQRIEELEAENQRRVYGEYKFN